MTGRRERKKAETRDRLLEAARGLLEHGIPVDELVLSDVSDLADVSTRTLFRYFDTKADLVLAACDVHPRPWRFDPAPIPAHLELLGQVVRQGRLVGDLVWFLADHEEDHLVEAALVAAGYLGVDVTRAVRHLAHQVLGAPAEEIPA